MSNVLKFRRGLLKNFIVSKMKAGEPAVVTDAKRFYLSFADGQAERIPTVKDVPNSINMLDNADWAFSLVNQRNHTGAVSNAYCIDRWIGNGTVTPVSGQYVTLASGTTMVQRMEVVSAALIGRQCTFSITAVGSSTASATISFPSSVDSPANTISLSNCNVELGFLKGSFEICGAARGYVPYIKITATLDINVKRVFLEFGSVSYAEQTPPTSYANVLARCQRYCLLLPNTATYAGVSTSAKNVRFSIITPVTMRIMPSLNKNELSLSAISASAGGSKTVTAEINAVGSNAVRMLTTIVDGADVTANVVQNVQIITPNVILSADL